MKLSPLDLPKIIEEFKKLISNLFFKGQEPTWLSPLINYILLGVLILLAAWGFLFVVSKIKKIWIEEFWPLFYKQEQKRRRLKRKRFAERLEYEIRQLNSREEWKDYRFTELEAEIEAEGRRRNSSLIPFIQTTQKGLRREKSLSKALEFSTERLILVEGEPGSGKSVALRHVTQKLAKKASTSNNLKSVIPLYINLKKLERDSQKIDKNLIELFVRKELNRINDRDIEEFLDNEFYQGLKEGTWLFLFDSFDELPEVLSSIEADEVTRSYAQAIDDFLNSLNNQCRGIIASRQFRGPKHLGWRRFLILPLENRLSWPEGVIHLLGILQDGFRSRLEDLGDNIKYQAERLLLSATVIGTIQDRKWALQVAGVTSQPVLLWLLRDAFASDSQWLKEVAYRQTARLRKIPDDIAADIRRNLLRLFATGRLYKERFTTEAHLSRLDNSENYLNVFRLLQWIKPIHLCLCLITFIVLIYQNNFLINNSYLFLDIFHWEIFLLLCSYLTLPSLSSILSSMKFSFFRNNRRNNYFKRIKPFVFIKNLFSLFIFINLLFLSFPMIVWSNFAIMAVYSGKFTYPLWWLFLIVFPILYLIYILKIVIKNTQTIIIKLFRQYVLSFFLLAVIISLSVYLMIYLFQDILAIFVTRLLMLWVSIVFFSMPISLIFYIFYVFFQAFQYVKTWFTQWRKWKKWVKLKDHPDSIIAEDILNDILLYNNQVFCEKIIIYSRRKNLIIANKKSEILLTEFALILERSLLLGYTNYQDIYDCSSSEFLSNWLKQYTRKDKYRLANLGSEFLDELYMLIEQIQARQKIPEKLNN